MQMVSAMMHAHQAGGMEELQTDVMRFMAILAFCLVAIFALVQSIPLSPAEPATVESPPVKAEIVSGPETPDLLPSDMANPLHSGPVFDPVTPKQKPKPKLDAASVTRFAYRSPAPKKPVAQTVVATPPPEPAPKPKPEPVSEPMPEPQKGFTLRFASATALRELVGNNQVRFFALTSSESWRLNEQRGQLYFASSRRPRQMHEMTSATVPAEVLSALNRAGVSQSRESVRWGVVLTDSTSRQLQQILRSHEGGALTILSNGSVKLEPAGGNTGSRGGPA